MATTSNTLGYYEDPVPALYVGKIVDDNWTISDNGLHQSVDGSGTDVNANALKVSSGERVMYQVAQYVYPNQSTYLAFDTTLDPCLELTGYTMFNDDWAVVNSSFSWAQTSGNRVIAERTLTEEESNCKTYRLYISAKVKDQATLAAHGHAASTYWNLSTSSYVWSAPADHPSHGNGTNASWLWGNYTKQNVVIHANGGVLDIGDSSIGKDSDGNAIVPVRQGSMSYWALGVSASLYCHNFIGFFDAASGGNMVWNSGGGCIEGQYWKADAWMKIVVYSLSVAACIFFLQDMVSTLMMAVPLLMAVMVLTESRISRGCAS